MAILHRVQDPELLNLLSHRDGLDAPPAAPAVIPDIPKITGDHVASYYYSDPPSYIFLIYWRDTYLTIYVKADGTAYTAKSHFSKELFHTGTVIKGTATNGLFIAHDVNVRGSLKQRIKALNHILDYCYLPDPALDPYTIIANDYVESRYIKSFIKHYRPRYAETAAGIRIHNMRDDSVQYVVAIPRTVSARPSTDQQEQEMVLPQGEIVDLLIRRTSIPDNYELYARSDDKRLVRCSATIAIPDKETSRWIKSLADNSIVSSKYNKDFRGWTPVALSLKEDPDILTGRVE